jgi:hypothetical protein
MIRMIQLTIQTPEQRRQEAKVIQLQKALEAEKEQILSNQRIENYVEQIFNHVKEKMSKSSSDYGEWIYLYTSQFKNAKIWEVEKAANIVRKLLDEAGYGGYLHEYSSGWQERSGKICYFSVDWSEKN